MALTPNGVTENLPSMLKRARRAADFTNAKDFLAAVKASGRKAPSYSTYAQWESGEVVPRDNTLDPVIAYHRERNTWPSTPSDDVASAIREQTQAIRDQTTMLQAVLIALAGPTIDPTLAAWGERVRIAVSSGLPLPKPDHPPGEAG